MTTKQIHQTRAALAFALRSNGAIFSDIRDILKANSKEVARQLVGRGRRMDEMLSPFAVKGLASKPVRR